MTIKHLTRRSASTLLCMLIAVAVSLIPPDSPSAAAVAFGSVPAAATIDATLVNESYTTWTVGGGFLYWGECIVPGPNLTSPGVEPQLNTGYLRRASTGGRLPRTLSTNAYCEQYIVADATGLFGWNGAKIQKRPVEAPDTAIPIYEPNNVITHAPAPPVARLALDKSNVYWLSATKVMRVGKDGTNLTALADVGSNPTSLALSDSWVYWFDDRGLMRVQNNCDGQPCPEEEFAPGWRGRELVYTETRLAPSVFAFMFWIDGRDLRAFICDLSGCRIETRYTAPATYDIGVLATYGTTLYWTEQLYKCDIGGGNCVDLSRVQRLAHAGGTAETIAEEIPGRRFDVATDELGIYHELPNQIVRLPFNTAALIRDLRADDWEVTQGIQNLANDVGLIASKATFVRVYPKQYSGPPAGTVEAALEGTRNGQPLPGSPLRPLNGSRSLTTGQNWDRSKLNDSWLFQLPTSWTGAGALNLTAIVDPRVRYTKTEGTNRRSGTFSFTAKAPICAVFIPVRTHSAPARTDQANFQFAVDMARRLLPANNVWVYSQDNDVAQIEARFGIPPWKYEPYSVANDGTSIMVALWTRDQMSDDPDECDDVRARTHYVGMVHQDAPGGPNGKGSTIGDQLFFKFPPPDFSRDWRTDRGPTLAHEFGHNYGRRHVDCPVGSPADPGGYPYPTCQMAPIDPRGYYGFNINTREIISPMQAGDLMSYAPARWTSDYTWRGMINELNNHGLLQTSANQAPAPSAAQAGLAAATAVVLVSGIVDPTGAGGRLNHAYVLPTATAGQGLLRKWQRTAAPIAGVGPRAVNPQAPAFHLRLVGADGAVLDDREVVAAPLSDDVGQPMPFLLTMPAPTKQVARIELLDGATLLARLQPGAQTPTVTMIAPAGGETVDKRMTISWQASDGDGADKLLYTVQYSPDAGQSWRALVTDYPNLSGSNTVTLELSKLDGLPASTTGGQIRVLASDGYHTGVAVSQPFTVVNRAPDVFIAAPTPNVIVPAGEAVILRGNASDAEDGGLSETALRWSVDDVAAGDGAERAVAGLAPGTHAVKLTARDSQGREQTTSAPLRIAPLSVGLGAAPELDGSCDDGAFAAGTKVELRPYLDGSQATAHLLRTTSDLWVCFSNLHRGNFGQVDSAGIRVDVDNSRDATRQPSDLAFFVASDGMPSLGAEMMQSRISRETTYWSAELRISGSAIGGLNHLVGIDLAHQSVIFNGDDYHWPFRTVSEHPATWATTVLGVLPRITSLSPASADVAGDAFTLTVNGANFEEDARVRWNGKPRPTTFVDSTTLRVEIPAGDLATGASLPITVVNPYLLSAPSNSALFTVNNLAPTLTSLMPKRAKLGATPFTFTINGANFVAGASVFWNGAAVPTTFVSPTQLRATISANLRAVAGDYPVVVVNPAPSGGGSNLLRFVLGEQPGIPKKVFLPLVRR